MTTPPPPCLGIDLGTTTSTVGWVQDGQATLLEVDGDVLVPSLVFVPKQGPLLVGQAAADAGRTAPERLIRSSKRAMGTTTPLGPPDRPLTAAQVGAAILSHLANAAEAKLGQRANRVVISVPARFRVAERADTRRAGELAGLTVVRLVNEPTAAALAHHGAALTSQGQERLVLVYDFGGGTFDVSLVRAADGVVEVVASRGEHRLGGDDVDAALLQWLAQRTSLPAETLSQDHVLRAVQAAKHTLSHEARVDLSLPEGPRVTLEREDLDDACLPLVRHTVDCVLGVLEDAATDANQVHELILVGGSSALPLVWRTLHQRTGLEASSALPPRRAVGLGAVAQAGLVDGEDVAGILVDVASASLSIGVAGGGLPGYPTNFLCEVITPRNAPLPARHTHLVHTSDPLQTRIRLPVYQGSDPDPRKNTFLGEIVMTDLPPAPDGELQRPIAVTFDHDLDAMVRITITDQLTGRHAEGTVVADGAEAEAGQAAWQAHAQTHDLEFGDPRGHAAQHRTDDAARRQQAKAQPFERVLAQEALVRKQATDNDAADAVLDIARRGKLAAGAGQDAALTSLLEALEDALFDAGVYL